MKNINPFQNGSPFDTPNLPTEIQNSQIYNYYRSRLINLYMSRFEWDLPDTCDQWFLEDSFLRSGTACFMQEINTGDWLSLGYVYMGTLNLYGYPTEIRGVGYAGGVERSKKQFDFTNIIPAKDKFVVGFDNMSRTAPMVTINTFAYLLWEIHMTYRSNLTQQNTPYLITAPKNLMLSIKNIMLKLFGKERVIELNNTQNIEDIIKVLDLKVDFKGKELLETLAIVWNMALSMLGLMNGTQKKERMIQVETDMNEWENLTVLGGTLLARERMLDKAIKLGMPGNPDVKIRKIPLEELVAYPATQMMYTEENLQTGEPVEKGDEQ